MSEIWNQYNYLLNNYREGKLSRTSYCFKYAYERTLNAVWKEYKTQKSLVSLTTLTKEPITMNTPETNYIENEDRIELNDRLASVLRMMSPQDILIADDYMYGMTFEQIAMKFKISKGQVKKILQKYAK